MARHVRPKQIRVLRRFGQNRQDGFGDWQGLVISATDGSEVRAVQAGKVAYAGYLLGYGLVIVIAHNDGHATIYGHNQSLKVETGQAVLARQVIAIAGNTGSLDVTALYFGVTPAEPLRCSGGCASAVSSSDFVCSVAASSTCWLVSLT